jgi:anti-anti-sigma factor
MAQTPGIPELRLETDAGAQETVIRCIGKLTHTSAETLRNALRPMFPETKKVALDLKGLTYLDSFGLGVLVGAYLSARRQECHLRVANANPQAQQIIRITNLGYLLD